MKKIERREIQVGQYTVYYQVVGEGEPIVLVHGLSGSFRWWRRNVPALSEHYRVYLIDLPGFGMMRHFPRRLTLDEVVDELVAWMKAVGIAKAHLIAHSMGGYIYIRVAATRSEVVDRLVLVSPVLGDVLRQEITHSHLLLLKRAGHVGMFDQPEEFNGAVLAFLRGEEVGR